MEREIGLEGCLRGRDYSDIYVRTTVRTCAGIERRLKLPLDSCLLTPEGRRAVDARFDERYRHLAENSAANYRTALQRYQDFLTGTL
jgi:hypothetical protein